MKVKKKDLILPPEKEGLRELKRAVSYYLGPGHEDNGDFASVQYARVMASITGEINQLMAEGLWAPNWKRELLKNFEQLDEKGKEKLTWYSDLLVETGMYKIE